MPGQWWELSNVRCIVPPQKLVRRKFWLLLSVVLREWNNVSMRLSTWTLMSVDLLSTNIWQTHLTMPDSNKCIMSNGVVSVMPNGLWPNFILKKALSQQWANMASRAAMYSFISFSRALLWWWDSGGLPGHVSGATNSCATFVHELWCRWLLFHLDQGCIANYQKWNELAEEWICSGNQESSHSR